MLSFNEEVVLVDDNDNEIGIYNKLDAHRNGLKHRAFSVFLFNSRGETLIQQRAKEKYHSGGLWANSCCGHPKRNETVINASQRRVQEELGLNCQPIPILTTSYCQNVANGMTENEFTHVLFANVLEEPKANPHEVMNTRWISLPELLDIHRSEAETLCSWFTFYIENFIDQIFFHNHQGFASRT